MSEAVPGWYAPFARALTGDTFTPATDPEATTVDAAAFVTWLAQQGWEDKKISAYAHDVRAGGDLWPAPFDVPTGLGPAQQSAVLRQVLDLLGNPQWHTESPRAPRPPTRDDLRLLREVPPHHG